MTFPFGVVGLFPPTLFPRQESDAAHHNNKLQRRILWTTSKDMIYVFGKYLVLFNFHSLKYAPSCPVTIEVSGSGWDDLEILKCNWAIGICYRYVPGHDVDPPGGQKLVSTVCSP